MKETLRSRIVPTILCALPLIGTGIAWAAGPAGVKLDGTLGGAAKVLAGPTYNISQPLGRLAGSNLFFSFQYFNIAVGETALFSTTSAGINNVVSRVTGGYESSINGTIRLNAASGAPNFFLINPSGVTFGPGAAVDVPAAFSVATADYLKFPDGNFYADPSKQSTLSAASPQAFGFLGQTRSAINIDGVSLTAGASGSGEFQVVAGDVTIDGGTGKAGISNGTGAVRLVAIGSAAIEVPLSGSVVSDEGTVLIQNGGSVTTTGGAGAAGGIYIGTQSLTIDATTSTKPTGIVSVAGSNGAGPVLVDASGAISLVNGGSIITLTTGDAKGADVTLNGADVTLDAGSESVLGASQTDSTGISVVVAGAGEGGAVNINTGRVTADGTGKVATKLFTGIESVSGGEGNAGSVAIDATGSIAITNGSQIITLAEGKSAGGGNVSLQGGSLIVDSGASGELTRVVTQADGLAAGSGGNISVNISGAVNLANSAGLVSLGCGLANAGDITVSDGSLKIDGGSQASAGIVSATSVLNGQLPSGSSGTVSINHSGPVTMLNGASISSGAAGSGNGGNVSISASSLTMTGGTSGLTEITATASGTGLGGNITIDTTGAMAMSGVAPTLGMVTDVAVGTGNAGGSSGNVTINTGSLSIDGGGTTVDIKTQNLNSLSSTGEITIKSSGAVSITDGGVISTIATTGAAGGISIGTDSLTIDGTASARPTGIGISSGGAGAGPLVVDATGGISMIDGGDISTATTGAGKGADLTLTGDSVSILGASPAALTGIQVSNSGMGEGGTVTIHTGTLNLDGTGKSTTTKFSGIDSLSQGVGNPGSVAIDATGNISIANGGQIVTLATGASLGGGGVSLQGASLNIDSQESAGLSGFSGILTQAAGLGPTGSAGSVTVKMSGAVNLENTAGLVSVGAGNANSGDITVTADSLKIDGGLQGSALISSTTGALNGPPTYGASGDVSINTRGGPVDMIAGAQITSGTFGYGNAGTVMIGAGSLTMMGGTSGGSTQILAVAQGSGLGGNITIDSTGAIEMSGVMPSPGIKEAVSIGTGALGNSGNVTIHAGSLEIDGAGTITDGTGTAVGIETSNLNSLSTVGSITITTSGAVTLKDGAFISSATFGDGNAGDVVVNAGSLDIDGGSQGFTTTISSATVGNGAGGQVTVNTPGAVTLSNGGLILSDAAAPENSVSYGNAGSVVINAGSLAINGGTGANPTTGVPRDPSTGITSDDESNAFGSAGSVTVIITGHGSISLTNGAEISSSTEFSGDAGSVSISTPGLVTVGGGANKSRISSSAYPGSLGQPGTVSITAGTLDITSSGAVTVQNDDTYEGVIGGKLYKPTAIDIHANTIALNGGTITADSTGHYDASSIDIHTGSMRMNDGEITTSAESGSGGEITINASGILWLQNSQITSSVLGDVGDLGGGTISTGITTTSSNGGDINISAPFIVLDTAAIQANTVQNKASGGKVTIRAAGAIIPSFQELIKGGPLRSFDPSIAGLNLIQAAAPDGVGGVLNVTNPTLDIGSSLLGLTARPAVPTPLTRGLCGYSQGSSLLIGGRGGLPIFAGDPFWIALDESLTTGNTDTEPKPPVRVANANASPDRGCQNGQFVQ